MKDIYCYAAILEKSKEGYGVYFPDLPGCTSGGDTIEEAMKEKIDQTKKDKNSIETESARRIVKAFDFFSKSFADKDELFLTKMLKTVSEATCTTHPVKNESEAIQMFIFQNNRGKKPSNLGYTPTKYRKY